MIVYLFIHCAGADQGFLEKGFICINIDSDRVDSVIFHDEFSNLKSSADLRFRERGSYV